MPVVRLALTAVGVAMAVARNPVVRAGVRAVADNPQAKQAAVNTVRRTAYSAGVLVRRIIPRSIVD